MIKEFLIKVLNILFVADCAELHPNLFPGGGIIFLPGVDMFAARSITLVHEHAGNVIIFIRVAGCG